MQSHAETVEQVETLLDTEAAARFLGKSPRTITRLVKRGLIPYVSFPGSQGYRFRPETLNCLIRQFETVNPTASDIIRSAR